MNSHRRYEPKLTRRHALSLAAAVPVSAAIPFADAKSARSPANEFVLSNQFEVQGINLNGAGHHPLPIRSARAIQEYAEARAQSSFLPSDQGLVAQQKAITVLSKLLNTKEDELMLVPSASYGESLLVAGLGLLTPGCRVVTDALHWKSSLYQYSILADTGLNLIIVPQRDWRIDMEEMERAIVPGTTLVSVSLISYLSGFQHDLAALTRVAHRNGALVYVDATQAAGAVPFDIQASGVDFCAGSGYKWLMGEAGVAFLYASLNAQKALRRCLCGYRQLASYSLSLAPDGNRVTVNHQTKPGIAGLLSIGSLSHGGAIALATSLEMISELGVQRISEKRQPLLRRLECGMAALGFRQITPSASTGTIMTFQIDDPARRLDRLLIRRGIAAAVGVDKLRISPSVYNSMDDIEALLDAMKNFREVKD